VAYYYVEYGTNLAFLSRPSENFCDNAVSVLAEVRQAYPDDPTLMSIVEDSEGICRRLADEMGASPAATTEAPQPAATPQEDMGMDE